jgi:hypothetical protein
MEVRILPSEPRTVGRSHRYVAATHVSPVGLRDGPPSSGGSSAAERLVANEEVDGSAPSRHTIMREKCCGSTLASQAGRPGPTPGSRTHSRGRSVNGQARHPSKVTEPVRIGSSAPSRRRQRGCRACTPASSG